MSVPALSVPELLIASDTVALRPFTIADVPAVTEACQDLEISRWTASIPWPYSEADAVSWISSQPAAVEEGRVLPMAIVGATGQFAGSISLNTFDWEIRTAQVGYWVAAPSRGKGVATAALRAITDWGFESLDLSLVTLLTLVGNVASERVAEHARFEKVGEMRDYRHAHSPDTSLHVKVWTLPARSPRHSRAAHSKPRDPLP